MWSQVELRRPVAAQVFRARSGIPVSKEAARCQFGVLSLRFPGEYLICLRHAPAALTHIQLRNRPILPAGGLLTTSNPSRVRECIKESRKSRPYSSYDHGSKHSQYLPSVPPVLAGQSRTAPFSAFFRPSVKGGTDAPAKGYHDPSGDSASACFCEISWDICDILVS